MKCVFKYLYILSLLCFVACSTQPKKSARTQEIQLGAEDFISLFFNLIEVKSGDTKTYVVSAAFSYEGMPELEIKLKPTRPLIIAIDGSIEKLNPLKNKYQHIVKKVSKGRRVLHVQMNDYAVTKEMLNRIAKSKSAVVKIPAEPHKDYGFDGVFRKDGLIKLSEFIE